MADGRQDERGKRDDYDDEGEPSGQECMLTAGPGAVLGADKGNRFREACGPPLGDGIFNSRSPLHLWWGLHAGYDSITQVLPLRLGDDGRRGCDPWRQLPGFRTRATGRRYA